MNWTTIIAAIVGLAGGVISGGLTAYTQLSSAEQEFSISRAEKFKELFEDLRHEDKSRIALLNLWQLYPDKRDQKIIVAAAVEVDQPDLIETIVSLEEEILQYSGILQTKVRAARIRSDQAFLDHPAMQILTRFDPPRAAELLIERIDRDLRFRGGDRYLDNASARELRRLATLSPDVGGIISEFGKRHSSMPVLFEQILYASGKNSALIERLEQAFATGENVDLFNPIVLTGNFRDDDTKRVVEIVQDYIVRAQNGPVSSSADIAGSISGLKNSTFRATLRTHDRAEFRKALAGTIIDQRQLNSTRLNAMELAGLMSERFALTAIAQVITDESADDILRSDIASLLDGYRAADGRPGQDYPSLDFCGEAKSVDCLNNGEGWRAWLVEAGKQS